MSLRHAILTALLDADASGYELAKHFDLSVANFWHALPTQLYPELARLNEEGLVRSTDVAQDRRPNKRVYAITDGGREELRRWVCTSAKPMSLKDELVLRVRSGADSDPDAISEALRDRRQISVAKLEGYRAMQKQMLGRRDEGEFLRSARRVGPYLTLLGGIALEQEHLRWIDHVQNAIETRRASTSNGKT